MRGDLLLVCSYSFIPAKFRQKNGKPNPQDIYTYVYIRYDIYFMYLYDMDRYSGIANSTLLRMLVKLWVHYEGTLPFWILRSRIASGRQIDKRNIRTMTYKRSKISRHGHTFNTHGFFAFIYLQTVPTCQQTSHNSFSTHVEHGVCENS